MEFDSSSNSLRSNFAGPTYRSASLLESNGPVYKTLERDSTVSYILVTISIIIILITWAFLARSASSDLATSSFIYTCNPGDCPTNVSTGEKRCAPDVTTSLPYDPSREVCNPKTGCTNSRTPYAVREDGSSELSGICPNSTTCRCVANQTFPLYIMSSFKVTGGSPYGTEEEASNYVLTQETTSTTGSFGDAFRKIANRNIEFPSVGVYDLARLSPGACYLNLIPTSAQVRTCIASNPCISGTLAYLPTGDLTAKDFSFDRDFRQMPLGCVSGIRCPAELVPVWDTRSATIACL